MRQQRPLGINEASHAQATWARLQPEVPEMDPAPQSGTHKMHLSAVPRLELSDRHWGTKCESHGHHWGYWGLEHWLCKDRLWELGLFSLRGDGFWGIQLMSTDAQQKREYGGRLFSDIQLPDDRQKLQVEINQFWLNLIFFFFFFHSEGCETLRQAPQRCCENSMLGDTQNFARQSHDQHSLTKLVWPRWFPEVTSKLNYFMLLLYVFSIFQH